MKNAIVVLLLLISTFCKAQKLILIRPPWSMKSYTLPPLMINRDKENTKKIEIANVYIDKPGYTRATYYFRANKQRKFVLEDNKTHFVYVFNRFFVRRSHQFEFKEIPEQEFRELYSKKEWLRKALARQGYENVDDVINK